MIIPPFLVNRVPLVSRLVDIAHNKGVKHVAFTTPLGTQTEDLDIFKDLKMIQNKIRSYDTMAWTLVGSSALMENLLRTKKMIASGSLCLPLGSNNFFLFDKLTRFSGRKMGTNMRKGLSKFYC